MTYFEMVNEVLIRMREVPLNMNDGGVDSDHLDPQQQLACKFVNDARTFVERAHTWNACRKVWIVDLGHGVSRYNLRGGTEQSVVSFVQYDNGPLLKEVNQHEISKRRGKQGNPTMYAPSWVGDDSTPGQKCVQLEVWPKPDNTFEGTGEVYEYTVAQFGLGKYASTGKQLHVYGYGQPHPLKENNDPIIVPDDPVMHFALAYAISERGEAGGGGAPQAFALAKQYLSDAISLDANNSRGEYIWEAV